MDDQQGDESLVDTDIAAAVPPEPPLRRRSGLIASWTIGILLIILAGVYATGYLLAGDNVPKDAEVGGVAIGGLDRAAAIHTLTEKLKPTAEKPIIVMINKSSFELKPGAVGLGVDYAGSVDQAGAGKSLDPRHIWKVLTGGSSMDPVRHVDQAKLRAAVAELAKKSDHNAKNATLSFKGATISRTDGQDRVSLDQQAAVKSLRKSYLVDDRVELKADVSAPDITTAEVDQVVKGFARQAVAAPVKIQVKSEGSLGITPTMIGRSIVFKAEQGKLVWQLDAKKLRKEADKAVQGLDLNGPRDATVRLSDGKPTVVPARDGSDISAENLARAVQPAMTKTGADRAGQVALTDAKADFTTEDAQRLGIKKVTGQFTTRFPYAEYRNVNLTRAAALINNTVLKPGETFSLNGVVGERTKANGFIEGYIIEGGKFTKELGGGVSQSATTTYNAMFFAGLKDIEHQPHTLYIDRYPAGREATVAWPNLDLKFQNDTKYGVLVQASVSKASPGSKGSITVRMWSTKTYQIKSADATRSNYTTGTTVYDDSGDCEAQAPVPGFDADYSRTFLQHGQKVRTEHFHWRYAPTNRIVCGKKP